jgi:hypothetical protein
MNLISSSICYYTLLSFDRLSKKPLLFKSFTGLTLQEFDDINDKEITKRYENKIKTFIIQNKIRYKKRNRRCWKLGFSNTTWRIDF